MKIKLQHNVTIHQYRKLKNNPKSIIKDTIIRASKNIYLARKAIISIKILAFEQRQANVYHSFSWLNERKIKLIKSNKVMESFNGERKYRKKWQNMYNSDQSKS